MVEIFLVKLLLLLPDPVLLVLLLRLVLVRPVVNLPHLHFVKLVLQLDDGLVVLSDLVPHLHQFCSGSSDLEGQTISYALVFLV